MDNICTICFENDSLKNLCTLKCKHCYHLECILQWINKPDYTQYMAGTEKICIPFCPYCRQPALLEKIPDKFDAFYKFYYFTKFVRKRCSVVFCPFTEFPCNDGKCSYHYYPLIDKHDLQILMDKLFSFFFMPLNVRKTLLCFAIHCFDYNLRFDELYIQLQKLLLDAVQNTYLTSDDTCSLIIDFASQNGINLQKIRL